MSKDAVNLCFIYPSIYKSKKTCTRSDRSLGDKKSITSKATFFHFFADLGLVYFNYNVSQYIPPDRNIDDSDLLFRTMERVYYHVACNF